MSLVTINNVAVIGGSIMLPPSGVWTADLQIDQADLTGFDPSTAVTIAAGDLSLSGVVDPQRAGDFLDAVHVRVLGGKGGMGKMAQARSYAQPGAFVRDVVGAVLGDAGETLSSTADAGFLATNLTAWAVMKQPVAQALLTLLEFVAPAMIWRVQPDGKVWIGTDTWATASGDYDLLDQNPAEGTFDLGVESPWIVPGTTVDGVGKVSRVEHRIEHNRIRSHVWALLDEERGSRSAIASIVAQEMAGLDYFALYEGTVKAQSADLATVDVEPTNRRIPGLGRVPLYSPAGIKMQVAPGIKVLVGWQEGDPRLPYAVVSPLGTGALQIKLNASSGIILNDGVLAVARQTDPVTGQAGPYPLANGQIAGGAAQVKA